MSFLKKRIDVLIFIALAVICYFLFFFNMGKYPLIGVDESRYVLIARDMFNAHDWLTLKLNNEFFFEKPPLFFWLLHLSFSAFGKISEPIARFPISLSASLVTFVSYFIGRKAVDRKFGFISALILATGFEFIALSRIAILDMLLSVCIIISTFLGFLTFFVKEENKKYCWWGFYVFSALASLAKGIPGIAIPFATLFFSYIVAGRFKELFKPVFMLPGVVLFFLISIPWHYAMIQLYGDMFFKEYVLKHHLARFLNSKDLGRKEPWFFFIIVFMIGFLPWSLTFISMIVDNFKNICDKFKNYFLGDKNISLLNKWSSLSSIEKFCALNLIFFLVTFLFFSSASTKLPTYILPAFAPAAMLLANYWLSYIDKGQSSKKIGISTIFLFSIFAFIAIAAVFSSSYLSADILVHFNLFKNYAIIFLLLVSIFAISSVVLKKRTAVFSSYIALMVGIAVISVTYVFNFVCIFGENDLIKFAIKSKNEQVKLATFDFGRRYVVNYYYEGIVDYQTENDIKWLQDYVSKTPNAYVIVPKRDISGGDLKSDYEVVESGVKYSLIRKKSL